MKIAPVSLPNYNLELDIFAHSGINVMAQLLHHW
jgi:hypothetical protein